MELATLYSLLIYGVFLSLMYALMAAGVTIIFGLMKLINFAHGEIYMLGGYIVYFFASYTGLNPIFSLPFAFLGGFVIGQAIEVAIIRQTYTKRMSKPDEYAIIVTFGLSLFLQNFALLDFGYLFRDPPPFVPGLIAVGTISVSGDTAFASVISAATLVGLALFINRTWAGLSMRATSQNILGAQLAGIRPTWTNNLGFALGAGLAALAGALLAPIYEVYPYVGQTPILTAFTVVVLGGLGSIRGAIIAAFIVGMAYSVLGVLISFSYVNIYGLVILFAVLVVRPRGLFGQKERTY